MKRVFCFMVFAFLPLLSNAACVDLNGDYDSGVVSEGKGKLIWSLKQNGCETIATGSYYLWDTTKTDEVKPFVNLVHAGKEDLCEVKKCFVFNEYNKGFEYAWNGSVRINGAHVCHSDRVEISLENQKLVRTFDINDSSPNCKKIKNYRSTMDRIL